MLEERLHQLSADSQERLARARAEAAELPYINLVTFPINAEELRLVARDEATAAQAVVFYRRGKDVRIGAVQPDKAQALAAKLATRFGATPQVFVISARSMAAALARYPQETPVTGGGTELLTVTQTVPQVASLSDLGEKITLMSPTELLSVIAAGAVAVGASDVHIEPGEKIARLRYRVDGVLNDVATFAREGWRLMLSRIKVMAKLKLNVKDMPQDGSFVLMVGQDTYDVRVSTLPGGAGENIVLRLLNRTTRTIALHDLGMKRRDYELIGQELKKDHGMILVTGPTGSGKTTTLAAALGDVNRPEVKIITLEDPIEYHLSGVEQTQVDERSGYTFAVGLRSILRQDPDVIMVGEMRDVATAEVALHAAMTGHLVLTTLHTNDAVGAVTRLVDFGIKPFVLAPAINLVVAQRLMRVVCKNCAEDYTPAAAFKEHIQEMMAGVVRAVFDPSRLSRKIVLKRAKGCAACHGTGYKGRIGVFEMFAVTGEIEELILAGQTGAVIKQVALQQGMTTILQDAYLKVLDGITTVDEVERVTAE